MLADLDARRCGALREPPDEPRRLEQAVGWMEDRGRVPARERRREIVAPLDRESVRAEGLVLGLELVALLLVGGETQASGLPERVARAGGELGELALGPAPELGRPLAPDRSRR